MQTLKMRCGCAEHRRQPGRAVRPAAADLRRQAAGGRPDAGRLQHHPRRLRPHDQEEHRIRRAVGRCGRVHRDGGAMSSAVSTEMMRDYVYSRAHRDDASHM